VDTEFFYPKPAAAHDHKVILIAECDWDVKGTDIAIKALSKIKDEVEVRVISNGVHFDKTIDLARHLGLHLKTLPKAPHEKINEYIWDSDLVIDRFVLDSLGMVSLEGIACGRPVVTYVSSEYEEYKDFPLKDVKEEEGIISAITDSSDKFWRQEYAYLEKNHLPSAVIPKLLEIYEEVIRD
jgi:glycosyltransferase involved in cell wall biosynthesis